MTRRLALAMLIAAVACYPTTTRPPFNAEPTAATTAIELPIDKATTALAIAFDTDSIPVARTEAKDGWLETGWFDAHTLQPTNARPVGPDVVKLRAFIDPAQPNYSSVTVEVVYRPMVNPTISERALERQVPDDHPVAQRVAAVLAAMVKQYGGVPEVAPPPPPAVPGRIAARKKHRADSLAAAAADSAHGRPDPTPVRPDSTRPPVDTVHAHPDTVHARPDSTRPPPTDTTGRHKPR